MGESLIITSPTIDGVLLTPLQVINVPGGDVMHGMKSSDPGYSGFGEAYFSTVDPGALKAWKRHREMTLNLVVPVGAVRFVIYDDRHHSETYGAFQEVVLSRNNFCRLTIPPKLWIGFQSIGEITGILLNIADIQHSPEEVDLREINIIKYNWELRK